VDGLVGQHLTAAFVEAPTVQAHTCRAQGQAMRSGRARATHSVRSSVRPWADRTVLRCPSWRVGTAGGWADAAAADARAMSARLGTSSQVRQMRSLVGSTTPVAAFRGTTANWSLLIEESATGRILSVLEAGNEAHVGAIVDDTAYVLEGQHIVVSPAATGGWRDLRLHDASTAATLPGLARPVPAEPACPICAGQLGSCALAVAACGSGCAACCTAAVAICALAFNCCFNQYKEGRLATPLPQRSGRMAAHGYPARRHRADVRLPAVHVVGRGGPGGRHRLLHRATIRHLELVNRRRLLAAIALTLGGTIGLVAVASAQIVERDGRRVIAKPIHRRVERTITTTLEPR
jgi:hypothetical protein